MRAIYFILVNKEWSPPSRAFIRGLVMSGQYDATGSLTGYLFQCRYALLAGIRAYKNNPGLEISIEKFDDVAFEEHETPEKLIQTKHHAVAGNLTDMSVDLWGTLRIWAERVAEEPNLPFETQFAIVTTGIAPKDSAAAHLRSERDADSVTTALSLLEIAAAKSKSDKTKAARKAFLGLNSASRLNLVNSIVVYDKAPNIIDVRDQLEEMFWSTAPEQHITTFVDYLEGWWFAEVVTSLSPDAKKSIPVSAIRSKIDELRESFKIGALPIDDHNISLPSPEDLSGDNRTFVNQLRIIGARDKVISRTVRDYYRASEQRSKWARENLLLDGETTKYDEKLTDRWERQFEAAIDRYQPFNDECEKEKCGREVFHWCNNAPIFFRNRSELWLSAGSFQILSDQLKLGWHPDYEAILGQGVHDSED